MKQIIEKLKEQADDIFVNRLDPEAASWGMQEGVLISANEARQIVEALEGKEDNAYRATEFSKELKTLIYTELSGSNYSVLIGAITGLFLKHSKGKTKLPIIQRIQDRTTEEEKQLAEQIAEEAIAKINWVSVEDSAAPLCELVWAYDVRGMVVQAIRYVNDEKIITEVSSGENFTYSHWMTYLIPTAPEIEIHL